jgi:hypothetical protein
LWEDTVAGSTGHVSASPGAWLSVFLIIVAFILGTFALITSSVALWIAAVVALVAGIVGAFASKMMEQAY